MTSLLRRLIIPCLILLGLSSCRKHIADPVPGNLPSGFVDVFEQFWAQMNVNYVYWDIDTTNWDNVYRQYKPVFAALDIHDNNDIKKSVQYFRQMTAGLMDAHYAISFIPAPISDSFVYPALDRKIKSRDFHSPFQYDFLDSGYLDKGYIAGSYTTSGGQHLRVLSGTIDNRILYFGCNIFSLQEACSSNDGNTVKTAFQYFLARLHGATPAKAVIIDVRNNPGGNISDLHFLVGQLTNQPIRFGYTHYKEGNDRLSFTPWIAASIQPQTNEPTGAPIFVLADSYSGSLAETITMAIRVLPNTTFIGERTWGATGPITGHDIYNDGSFIVPGFLSVSTSSAAFRYIDGNSYESKGFRPDIAIPFNLDSLNNKRDMALETAIKMGR